MDLDVFPDVSRVKSSTIGEVNLRLTSPVISTIHAVGTGRFKLDDRDEGGGLEQSAHQLIEGLYPQSHYRAPQIQEGAASRELTDLLAVSPAGLCLVESKALSVINANISRLTSKRVGQVQKDIDKGLRQLTGAVRKVRSDAQITDRTGNEIQIPDRMNILINAIILISEMHPQLDWRGVASELITRSGRNTLIHILDLAELRFLVGASGHPNTFTINLVNRFTVITNTRSAFVRTRFPSDKKAD
jgi:hypothetical protein